MDFKLHSCRGLQVNARRSRRRGRALRQTPHPQATTSTTAASVGVSITAMVDSPGTLRAYYRYDPFGRQRAQGGALSAANVMRFSSKPWVVFNANISDGLYYYGYRFYDPHLQPWVNRDPIQEQGGINLHGFLRNNPVSFSDAYGLSINDPPIEIIYDPDRRIANAVYGPSLSPEECAALRNQILRNTADLVGYLVRYDPNDDGIGGWPMRWNPGKFTTQGGHYKAIGLKQRALKQDIERYIRKCLKCGNGSGGIPQWVDDAVNKRVDPPVIPIVITVPITIPGPVLVPVFP